MTKSAGAAGAIARRRGAAEEDVPRKGARVGGANTRQMRPAVEDAKDGNARGPDPHDPVGHRGGGDATAVSGAMGIGAVRRAIGVLVGT